MAPRPLLPPPSSRLYPGRGAHSCFQTAVHCEPPGPWINCPSPVRSGPRFLTKKLSPPHLHLYPEAPLLDPRWNLPEEQLIARLGQTLQVFLLLVFFFFLGFSRVDNDRSHWRNICHIAPLRLAEVRVDFISWRRPKP